MNRSATKLHLKRQVERQKAFFDNKEPGSLLAYISKAGKEGKEEIDTDDLAHKEGLAGSVYRAVIVDDAIPVPDEGKIEAAVGEFLGELRRDEEELSAPPPGDAIPCLYPHWDIGWHTAAMAGLPPSFSRGCWWLEPNMSWEEIEELNFNPENPWLVVAKHTHEALWKHWDEDFWTMPFVHRSPLDYANGLRGSELFVEILTDTERVKRLLEWCVDWQLQSEAFIYEGIEVPEGWGTGIMATWGPDRAVWINGDPVGLISRDMMEEFEQPYTGRLFTSTGGGFFHNHTLGLYQADQVASTPGIHMQNFTRDPNRPTVEETLLEDPVARDRILEASLKTPILISGMTPDTLQSSLPILQQGRFMLNIVCNDGADPDEIARVVRQASRID